MRTRFGWLACTALGAGLLVTGCGGSQPATPNFAPPDYSYLPQLRLSVANVTVEDHAAQTNGANDLGPTAPVPPDQALRQMAHDRLIAAGNSGNAVFTIDQASISGTGGGALDGMLAVHLDILGANGNHAGYAEAHVSRRFVPGSATSDDGTRAQLYSLTQQMMQDMNVELEYQVRRSLRDWLVDASGAPLAGSVEQQTLSPPGSGAGTSVGATPVGATPIGAGPAPGATSLLPASPAPAGPGPSNPGAASPGPASLAPSTPAPAAPPPMAGSVTRSPPPGFLRPPSSAANGPPAGTQTPATGGGT